MSRGEKLLFGSVEIDWVDDFISSVRPFIYVRREDDLLIRMPNRAYRLNRTGTQVLRYLLDGGTAAGLRERLKDPARIEDAALFLNEVRRALDDRMEEHSCSRAVQIEPLALGFSKLPVLSEVAVTARCNLRCAFCYYGCPSRPVSPHKPDLDAERLSEIFQKIRHEAKVPSVSLTGGEPSLRKDLPELVRSAVDAGLRVNLITNGTLISARLAGRLAAAGLSSAQISLEAPDAMTHDRITGRAGAFESACRAVSFLRERGVHVHTNTTLNRINISCAPRMPRFAKESLQLERLSMNMVIPAGTAVAGGDDILLRYNEMGEHVARVQAQSEEWGVEFMWYSPTPLCIFNPIPRGLGNKGCAACDGLLSIDVDGDLLPCSSWKQPVGNILRDDFREVWASAEATSIRFKGAAPPGCSDCDSFAVCHGACPLYWRRFGYCELGEVNDGR